MDEIYTLMGACPQHDLLWGGLTGKLASLSHFIHHTSSIKQI